MNPTPDYKIRIVNTDYYASYSLPVNIIVCGNLNLFLDLHLKLLVLFSKNCMSSLVTSTGVPFIKFTNDYISLTHTHTHTHTHKKDERVFCLHL